MAHRRYLVYIAGRSTPYYVGMMAEFLSQMDGAVEDCHFVIGDRYHYEWLRSQRLDRRVRVSYQHEALDPFSTSRRPSVERLVRFEERYGRPNLRRYVVAQRTIRHLPYDRQLAYLQAYLEYFEALCDSDRPDVLITGTPDSLPFLVCHAVFSKNGVVPLIVIPARIPDRFFVIDNDLEQVPGLSETYAMLKAGRLSAEDQELADAVREMYAVRRVRPSYVGQKRVAILPSPSRLFAAYRRSAAYDDRFFDRSLRENLVASITMRAKWPAQFWSTRRLQSDRLAEEEYVYYPLHYEPEFSIDILGTTLNEQLDVIDHVAATLPVGTRLYIKEHPNMFLGSRPLNFYRRLARIHGVTLVDRRVDPHDLMLGSRGVVTIAGTSGFEALFHGRRIVVFGRAFYDVFSDGVSRVGGPEDVARSLQHLVKDEPVDAGLLDRFVVALYRRSYPGVFETTSPGVDSKENFANLSRGLRAELEFRAS